MKILCTIASSRYSNPDEIACLLENEDDFPTVDSNSEEEDCVTQDDIRSDVEYEIVDHIAYNVKPDMILFYNLTKSGVESLLII